MRFVACLVGAMFVLSVSSALAAAPAKKTAKKAKKQPTPVAVAPEKDPKDTAVASCKKHIESMMKESAETTFGEGNDFHVEPIDGGGFDVSGWVNSKQKSGETKHADFMCHATRFGGGLWTTKTSLSYDK